MGRARSWHERCGFCGREVAVARDGVFVFHFAAEPNDESVPTCKGTYMEPERTRGERDA